MTVTKRIEWVDIAKGVGIIFVIFGHLSNGDGKSVWLPALDGIIAAIYLFHMPLFYVLGGFTFNARNGFNTFLSRKIRTLLIPYYIFSLYFLAKSFATLLFPSLQDTFQVTHNYDISHQFYDVLINGNGLWFLMAYFWGELFMYGLVKLLNNSHAIVLIGVVLIVFFYFKAIIIPNVQFPFQLLNGINATGFMCLGYAFRNYIKQISENTRFALRGGIASLLIYLASAFFCINCSIPIVFNHIISILAALSGTLATILFCVLLRRNRIFEAIGYNSIVYYALNALTLNIIKLIVFNIIGINASAYPEIFQLAIGVTITLSALGLLAIENMFVQRYMWWSIGKQRRANKLA